MFTFSGQGKYTTISMGSENDTLVRDYVLNEETGLIATYEAGTNQSTGNLAYIIENNTITIYNPVFQTFIKK